jgi:hypothetical protein
MTPPSSMNRFYTALPVRLQVFAPALTFVVLAATGLCILAGLQTLMFQELFSLWCSILAGPFSALWFFPENPNLTYSFSNLALLFAHPIWPNRFTAIVTGLAFAAWLFWGMAISFSGV